MDGAPGFEKGLRFLIKSIEYAVERRAAEGSGEQQLTYLAFLLQNFLSPANQRRMIRRFCGEVIHHLTGKWGVFDSKIAFLSTGSGNKEIYICDFDGYKPEKITKNKSINLFPAWSSDGKWLAYTSYARGKPDLYIKHLKEKRGAVVSKKGINTSPAWVPGQFALAATLSYQGNPEIYLLTGSGKIIKRITKKWGIDESATWSPDGKQIAFVSNRSGSPQIYIKNLDSGFAQRLTFEGKYNTQPSKLLHKEIIKILWPDLLKLPFNPSLRTAIKVLLAQYDLQSLAQKAHYKLTYKRLQELYLSRASSVLW